MLEIIYIVDYFRHRITRPDPIIEFFINIDVNIFIDRRAEHCTRLLMIKGCQIAAPASKTDS